MARRLPAGHMEAGGEAEGAESGAVDRTEGKGTGISRVSLGFETRIGSV